MSDRAIKDTLFVRLSTDILRDERLNFASALAQLVYLRGLVHAKASARDGIVSRRQVLGGLFDVSVDPNHQVMCQEMVDEAIGELLALELWEEADRGLQTYRVGGWLKHNDPVEAVENRRRVDEDGRRRGAHSTNHGKGLHSTPVTGCPQCEREALAERCPSAERSADPALTSPLADEHPEPSATADPALTDAVSPGQSAERALSGALHERSQRTLSGAPEVETELETELENTTHHPRSTQEGPDSSDGGGGDHPDAVAAQVISDAHAVGGLVEPRPPNRQEVSTVAAAMRRGWTVDQLGRPAEEAFARSDIELPRPWLLAAWKRMTNSDPPVGGLGGLGADQFGAKPIAPVRPDVGRRREHPDDCPGGCSDEGWIDGPNGLVKCHGQPAEATP